MLTFSSSKDDRAVNAARRAAARHTGALRAHAPGLARLGVMAVWLWSMVEVPAELNLDASIVQTFALAMSKLCLTALAGLVLMGNAIARKIFLLVCWLSILAIAPNLTLQFHYDRIGFVLSAIECLLKALTIIAFALPGLDYKVGLGEHARFDGGR